VGLVALMPQNASAHASYYHHNHHTSHNYHTQKQAVAELNRLLNKMQHERYNQPFYQPASFTHAVLSYQQYPQVETLQAIDVERHHASVYGSVDLNGQQYVDVWFLYGDNVNNLHHASAKGRVNYHNQRTFRADLTNLNQNHRYYYQAVARDQNGTLRYGTIRSFVTDRDRKHRHYKRYDEHNRRHYQRGHKDHSQNNRREHQRHNRRHSARYHDMPTVNTTRVDNIEDRSARLRGRVAMNDFEDGLVFFAYGEDRYQVRNLARRYDKYRDIDEDGDDLQVVRVDSNLDGRRDYRLRVTGLDRDTEHFASLCVEFEDKYDDQTITCGGVKRFTTDHY